MTIPFFMKRRSDRACDIGDRVACALLCAAAAAGLAWVALWIWRMPAFG